MAIIKYDKPVADYIAGLNATGHVTHRKFKKKSVTIHHNAGRLSHQGVLDVWKTRPASAHFDVDANGAVAQYVDVNEFAWATGNSTGNQESISIEMCNSGVGGNWPVSETTWKAAARLAGFLFATIIDGTPRPSSSNFHGHSFWNATGCPGPYMQSVWPQMLAEAQKAYDSFKKNASPAPPAAAKPVVAKPVAAVKPATKSVTAIVKEVIEGKWGAGNDRRIRLAKAGYNPSTIQDEVNRTLGASKWKPISVLAKEVIDGKWGSGIDRKNRLTKAGYSYQQIQNEVNLLLKK